MEKIKLKHFYPFVLDLSTHLSSLWRWQNLSLKFSEKGDCKLHTVWTETVAAQIGIWGETGSFWVVLVALAGQIGS